MTILETISDPQIFRSFLAGADGSLESWKPWSIALKCLYGLPIESTKGRELVQLCSGRSVDEMPEKGFQTALLLTGRRSGKSKIAAVIACFECLFGGHSERLSRGETGVVAIVSPTKFQSQIVWTYLAAIFDTPLLKQEVVDRKEADRILVLRNGLEIRIFVADYRSVRGISCVACIVDEICYMGGLGEESGKIRNDSELVSAIKPSLATTNGKLIAISSPYSPKGWAFLQWLKFHGINKEAPSFNPNWTTLVWSAASRTMNPTLSQKVVDAALLEDSASARSEYLGLWREDISDYVSRAQVVALVISGRKELMPRGNIHYKAFADLSGGRSDGAALAVAHLEGRKVIIDFAKLWKSPFSPNVVIFEMAKELRRFSLNRVTGDNYAAEFVSQSFIANGISYTKCEFNKSALYREMLPRICSSEVELLDDPVLIDQLAGLERKTKAGGLDSVDHSARAGCHDDLCNAVAGVSALLGKPRVRIGGWRSTRQHDRELAYA